MKALFLLSYRQFVRGGARTWFTWACAVICAALLGAVLFGGESLAAIFTQRSDLAQEARMLSRLVLVCLVLGLALLLRSVFRLSLSQRTRMLGQLASLGATRRQLRQSVWMEALILAACSIPVGLAAAAAGLAVVFSILRETGRLSARPVALLVRPQHVALAAACVLATLLLAAWGPARRAARLTPVEAVREVHVLPKRRGGKASRRVERLLAARSSSAYHYGASQTAVIAVCVFLVLLTLGFSDGMVRSYQNSIPDYDYRVYCWVRGGDEPAELARLVQKAAEQAGGGRTYWSEDTGMLWLKEPAAKVLTLDDAAFQAWYGAPLPDADEGVLSCVCASDAEQPSLFAQGERSPGGELEVTGICSAPLPTGLREQTGFPQSYLITTQSAYDAFPGKLQRPERLLQILVETQDATRLTPAVTQALEDAARQEQGLSLSGGDATAYTIQDFTETSEAYAMRFAAMGLLRICGGGFAALLAVGCTASVLSAASAQAQLRRREFALVRSAGMTLRDLRRMLALEARRRCLKGLALGLPAGVAAFFFLEKQLIPFYDFYEGACLADSLKAGLLVGLCAVLVCRAAHEVTLREARGASIRDDLTQE